MNQPHPPGAADEDEGAIIVAREEAEEEDEEAMSETTVTQISHLCQKHRRDKVMAGHPAASVPA